MSFLQGFVWEIECFLRKNSVIFLRCSVSKVNYVLKSDVWSRQSEKRASKLIPVSMQNLGLIRILIKKVVSFHFLIFWDGRRRTQHFHLKSQEFCSSSVYKSFHNNIYESYLLFSQRNRKEVLFEAFNLIEIETFLRGPPFRSSFFTNFDK